MWSCARLPLAALLLFAACARAVPPAAPGTPRHGGTAQPADASGGGTASHDDDGPVGANALAYLRADPAKLVVEVDAVEGREPPGGVTAHLRSVLASVAAKPDGVELAATQTIAAGAQRYSDDDLRALERNNRQGATGGGAASMYALVVNGSYASDEDVLGVAYSASAFAVFADRVRSASGPLGSPDAVLRALMVHEAGHLLRLVNIGYESPRGREDPEHPNHSANEGSAMHWAIETSAVATILDGPPPDDFDDADRADLADLREGRLG